MTARWLLLFGALLGLGAAEAPKPPALLPPAEAIIQGRALVADLLSQQPAQNLTNTGSLRIRDAKGKRTEFQVKFQIISTATNWQTVYEVVRTNGLPNGDRSVEEERIFIIHSQGQPNAYQWETFSGVLANPGQNSAGETNGPQLENRQHGVERVSMPAGQELMRSFAGSDFWIADLGLEFLHWPEQRVLKKEIRRGQSCNVLESVNPQPADGAYARVKSWIDIDTGGIVYAEACNAQGRVLKEFAPQSLKKVRGEWQLQEMEMENRLTGSRTWIEFNLTRN
jgi:hypothetical protein